MTTLREGNSEAWWRGMIGGCVLCRGLWQLGTDDRPEYYDFLPESRSGVRIEQYASPRFACPTIGCQGNVNFHPVVRGKS